MVSNLESEPISFEIEAFHFVLSHFVSQNEWKIIASMVMNDKFLAIFPSEHMQCACACVHRVHDGEITRNFQNSPRITLSRRIATVRLLRDIAYLSLSVQRVFFAELPS
jgi:hypothetical protein